LFQGGRGVQGAGAGLGRGQGFEKEEKPTLKPNMGRHVRGGLGIDDNRMERSDHDEGTKGIKLSSGKRVASAARNHISLTRRAPRRCLRERRTTEKPIPQSIK